MDKYEVLNQIADKYSEYLEMTDYEGQKEIILDILLKTVIEQEQMIQFLRSRACPH